ncbi:MAG: hypothetical protein WEB53_07485 [Akkermansiaceae bacterium]
MIVGITKEIKAQENRGSIFVDIAVDQGGCAETTRATTYSRFP